MIDYNVVIDEGIRNGGFLVIGNVFCGLATVYRVCWVSCSL